MSTPTDPLYLLGSIHVGNESLYPLPLVIENAFKNSDTLAVEVDITSNEDLADTFAEAALYSSGDTLQKHISKDTYRLIMKEIERYGVDPYRMQRVRPWALAMVISGLEGQKARVASEYGVDLHLLNRANFLKKRVIQLETMQFQVGLFKEFSDLQQELYLVDTIKNLSRAASDVTHLLRVWREGDTKTLEDFAYGPGAGDPRTAPIRNKILTARNKTMLVKVEEMITEPGTEFVVVGAAHLVGKDGIVELLKKKGYQVEQQ